MSDGVSKPTGMDNILNQEIAEQLKNLQDSLSLLIPNAANKALNKPTPSGIDHSTAPLQFTTKPTFTAEDREIRRLEKAMLYYIANQTDFLTPAKQTPESEKQNRRLLKHYIELYVCNPLKYPMDPDNPIHCVVHEAGDAVFNPQNNLKPNQSKGQRPPSS